MFDQPDVDDREFGPAPGEDDCPSCPAAWNEACLTDCDCEDCLRGLDEQRARQGQQGAA